MRRFLATVSVATLLVALAAPATAASLDDDLHIASGVTYDNPYAPRHQYLLGRRRRALARPLAEQQPLHHRPHRRHLPPAPTTLEE